MARIRTVKPEFWSDEKLGPLAPIDRLVFLGLVSQADDAGRLVDNVRMLDGLIFPYTEDTCRESLDTLARLSRIRRYRAGSGLRVIQIEGWEKHQKVDKPNRHTLPPPPPEEVQQSQQFTENSRKPRENGATRSRESRAPTLDLGPTTNDQETDSVSDETPAKPDPVSAMWGIWIQELGGKPPHPRLTADRRKKLRLLYREQLQAHDDPLALFRKIIGAVRASEHHMSKREFQMPESLFKSPERRDRWTQAALNGGGSHWLDGMSW